MAATVDYGGLQWTTVYRVQGTGYRVQVLLRLTSAVALLCNLMRLFPTRSCLEFCNRLTIICESTTNRGINRNLLQIQDAATST